ncbi:nucleotide disphospho-sugar-binding domain-containing protein [Dactylosporangium sp. NPDC000555]|uniref:nucleotide disphospho-sugar-binding domain-containing protein n=1 Tax=Dactylosporangium sp. NPDC000555 TaxID=3154260 RepID=UPI0033344554
MRFLFSTAPLHGHLYPLVPLAWACRARGHEVLVATTNHFVPAAQQTGLPVAGCGPGFDLWELADAGAAYGVADAPRDHGEVLALMASRNLAGTLSIVDQWRPDLVVAERSEYAGPVAAAARGIPYAEVHWGVSELVEYRAAARSRLADPLREHGLTGLPEPAAVFNPWPPSLRQSYAMDHLGLRHVPYDGASPVPDWMLSPADRPRICLTLGTILPHLAKDNLTSFVLDLLDELARLGVEVIVAVDDEFAKRLPRVPSAVRHVGRVPLSQVLRTSQILIHHGGQGSSLTALASGCVQVVMPKFDDMFANADAVVASGAGLSVPLDKATPDDVAGLCRELLADPGFGAAALRVSREIQAQPAPVDAARVLEDLASRSRRGTADE